MLVNVYTPEGRELIAPYPGTNLIQDGLGVVGTTVIDPNNRYRYWTIHALYLPTSGRAVGGIRAKLVDQKNFITFCNQRDLEVLLDVVSPGAYCEWLGKEYVDYFSEEWLGLCADEVDLIDDLYDRELEARAMTPVGHVLPPGMSFERRIHAEAGNDYIEEMMLLWDACRETMQGPDPRFDTVINRWTSIERTPHIERSSLWSKLSS